VEVIRIEGSSDRDQVTLSDTSPGGQRFEIFTGGGEDGLTVSALAGRSRVLFDGGEGGDRTEVIDERSIDGTLEIFDSGAQGVDAIGARQQGPAARRTMDGMFTCRQPMILGPSCWIGGGGADHFAVRGTPGNDAWAWDSVIRQLTTAGGSSITGQLDQDDELEIIGEQADTFDWSVGGDAVIQRAGALQAGATGRAW